jgi:hypothetical protein
MVVVLVPVWERIIATDAAFSVALTSSIKERGPLTCTGLPTLFAKNGLAAKSAFREVPEPIR